jgi:hypothetical protein
MAVVVNGHLIAVDCWDPESTLNFVSHAHSDHISGIRKNKKVIASRITKELIEKRDHRKRVDLSEDLEGITMLNAGHILGSKQMYAESMELGASILYSGDYQMESVAVAEPIELKGSDILIIDSTYPEPSDVFGDRQDIILSIQEFIKNTLKKGIILFSSYALGKAQEINRIANEIGILPLVDRKIALINEVYVKNGIKLEYLSAEDADDKLESALRGNFLAITSMRNFNEIASRLSDTYCRRVYTAVASGFAKNFNMGSYAQFPLSDHSDFKHAIEYIDACSPSKIYTRGNNESSSVFAKNLSKLGYSAEVFNGSVPPGWHKR